MGAHDGLQNSEHDDSGPDTPRAPAPAEIPPDREQSPPPDEPRSRGEVYADWRQRLEGGWEPRRFEAPRPELERFDPERAGLPPTSQDAADKYIAEHRTTRPWLAIADAASPEARRILAALDAGGGHAHIRHEGWVTEEANMRRAAYREDPAQLDSEKRASGIDGLKPGDRPHRCGDVAARVTDQDAFVTAFARGVEHPKVRAMLEMPFDPDIWPGEVTVPIAELLGTDGHQFCTGWQLEPVGGIPDAALQNRADWLRGRAETQEPKASPVPTFEGGDMLFVIGQNQARDGYEIVSMYPRPPRSSH